MKKLNYESKITTMATINITKGNDITLRAVLKRDGEMFPVEVSSDVSCYLVSCVGSRTLLTHDIIEEGTLLINVDGTIKAGTYVLEITGVLIENKWRTAAEVLDISILTEPGDSSVTVTGDTYDVVMEVQMYKNPSSDDAIKKHNEDQEAHPYIQDLISEVEGKIPVLPEHIVTDEDYVHTENNFTTEEKEKLGGLANYDDAEVRGLIAQKQDVIPDLATIRSGAQKGATAYQKPAEGIPESDVDSYIQEKLYYGENAYWSVAVVEEKIPSQASSTNQLADKDFVNSSISTATATFKGTYNSVAELEQVTADANDYAFVISTDNAGNTVYNRYKYSNGSWLFEYALNNPSFTAAQWAAINSAITSGDVQKLAALPTKSQLDALLAAKQDTLTFDNLPTQNSNNPVKSGGVFTALGSKAGKILVVQVGFPASDEQRITSTLQPNEIAEVDYEDYMNFALGTPTATEKCEYCLKFDVGSIIPTLSLPSGIIWAEEIELEANTHYVILISYENGGFYGDWKSYPLT